MSYARNLSRADELLQYHCDHHKDDPEGAAFALDRGRALDRVTWHRLLRERASDSRASQAEQAAARATLAAEGVTL